MNREVVIGDACWWLTAIVLPNGRWRCGIEGAGAAQGYWHPGHLPRRGFATAEEALDAAESRIWSHHSEQP